MNNTFETSNFDNVIAFIKPLLDENYQVCIKVDCDGIFMIDYCSPYNFSGESFELCREGEEDQLW